MEDKELMIICAACRDCLIGKRPTVASTDGKVEPRALFTFAELSGRICYLCLGIQSSVFSDLFLNCLDLLVRSSGYEFSTFAFNFCMPPSIKLRQAVLAARMELHLGLDKEAESSQMFDVKQSLKSFLGDYYAKKWSCAENVNAGILITLVFTNPVEAANPLLDKEKISKSSDLKNSLVTPKGHANHSPARLWTDMDSEQLVQIFPIFKLTPYSEHLRLAVELKSPTIYVKGRYNKYSRILSQTPWNVDGAPVLEGSVEEFIAPPLCKAFGVKGYKFHTAGREDIDVRMLGGGRPFVVELISPCLSPHNHPNILIEATEAINSIKAEVQVRDLGLTNRYCFDELSHGAERKVKAYCAVVELSITPTDEQLKVINQISELEIQQATPLRVLHRRTLMNRTKKIHALWLKKLNGNLFLLFLLTSAGTYVKEFVHGDLQRTQPNLGTLLGASTDIIQLDVLELFEECNSETLHAFRILSQTFNFESQK